MLLQCIIEGVKFKWRPEVFLADEDDDEVDGDRLVKWVA